MGVTVGLQPRVENAKKGTHVFRYSVSQNGGPFHVIRDFSQAATFAWTPALVEHEARVRLTVKNTESGETAEDEAPFRIVSRVTGGHAVVSPTAHPLVALFSAPPCAEGSQIRVAFRASEPSPVTRTAAEPCRGKLGNSLYVAGMRPDSSYQMREEVLTGSQVKEGDWLAFHTGLLDGNFPAVTVTTPAVHRTGVAESVIIHSVISMTDMSRPIAADLDGNIIWYLRQPAFLTRLVPGGHFLALGEGVNSANEMRRLQVLREFDLAGNVLRETNISRVAEQLASRGIHSDCKKGAEVCVPGFHHEAIRLPNGHTLALAGIERMFPAGTQGSKERIDILGDLILDLDEDFQVTWVWNAFDHMDVKRAAPADSKCKIGPGGGGCTAIFLADSANGWLHSNSLNYVPADGSLLISMPEQNWVLKVNYQNGKGPGNVLWRLGAEGDFKAKTTDPEPWFSFQHDAGFEPAGSNLLSVLDDGHERKKKHPEAHNRGQVWKIDEKAKTAELIYNADLGVYAIAVGSAQTLANGGYSFEAGFIDPGPSPYGRSIETSADGKVVYAQQVDGMIDYRSFRVPDLYSAPAKQ
ncbi:MAG TPA: hypothetical protein DEQ47_19145 [Solibacterales bacterium]|nr:hypothetical protein [Bryobacterales bacterium]